MNRIINAAIPLCLMLSSTLVFSDCLDESQIPPSTPTSRFSDQGNGTVVDNGTGLMWAKCSLGQNQLNCSGSATATNWLGALQAALSSNLASHSNWRLPNIKELRSLVERRCYAPSINSDVFPNTPATIFWSSSPTSGFPVATWASDFDEGSMSGYDRLSAYNLRLVRFAQ